MSKKDGGSAFPKYVGGNRDLAPGEEAGMTLRDYFAGQALQGLIASNDDEAGDRITDIPAYAYRIADAMLAERAK